MYLILDVDSEIERLLFEWDFQYAAVCFVEQCGMWSLILHVNDEEWADMRLLDEENILEEVFDLGLCNDDALE